jgi:RNA-directed DNA polymerase
MDDFVIMCASRVEAEQALHLANRQLATLRLALNEAKTSVASYADGVEFLGQALAPRRGGPRLEHGLASFDEAQQALRKAAGNVRRQVQRRIKR